MKREIENIIRRFVSVSGFSIIVLFIIGPVLHIIDGINNTQLGIIVACDFVAALSSLVFISSKELRGASWWMREILCIAINLAVTLSLTHYALLWKSVTGMIVIIIIIIIIAFGNHLIEFVYDMNTAQQLNKKLKEMR